MNKKLGMILVSAALLGACGNPSGEQQVEMDLENKHDQFSYCLGMDIAYNIQDNNFDSISVDALLEGVKAAMGTPEAAQYSRTESQDIVRGYIQQIRQQQMEAKNALSKTFLEDNAKKEGVVTLESGLQYEILKEGNGEKPTLSSQVTTHYHGTLVDGTVFDSSVERGEPATFPVNGVIAGWTEALQLMPVGSKWRLTVPANLAYGERGAGNLIGPNETLIFEVELLSIN